MSTLVEVHGEGGLFRVQVKTNGCDLWISREALEAVVKEGAKALDLHIDDGSAGGLGDQDEGHLCVAAQADAVVAHIKLFRATFPNASLKDAVEAVRDRRPFAARRVDVARFNAALKDSGYKPNAYFEPSREPR